ncbi:hypothetical protein Gste01_02132 [Geobacillus stearothermophilus ATCC 7953]
MLAWPLISLPQRSPFVSCAVCRRSSSGLTLRRRLTSILAQIRRFMKTYDLDRGGTEREYMRIFQDILYNPVLYRIVQELILFLYRLFHLPGTAFFLMTKAADARRLIDAVASFVGSYSIGLLITNKVFKEGKYTVKEAAIIATGFSTVSVTFMVVVAKTLGLMPIWNAYCFCPLCLSPKLRLSQNSLLRSYPSRRSYSFPLSFYAFYLQKFRSACRGCWSSGSNAPS